MVSSRETMTTPFAKTFVGFRRRAGFATAYQFYHKNGGRATFKCSFQNYLRIENGSHLPAPRRLPHLCVSLRLPLHQEDLRELITAYLRTWLGSDDLTDWMLRPLSGTTGSPAPLDPARQALARFTRGAAPLGFEHYRAVFSSAGAYWSFRVLINDKEGKSIPELSNTLGLGAKEIARGLEALKRCGIARRRKDGRYESPFAGKPVIFPSPHLLSPALKKKATRYTQAMLKRKGALIDVRHCGVRADARQIQGFIPYFREAIWSVNAYAVQEKTENSALFLVEGKVYKLFDF